MSRSLVTTKLNSKYTAGGGSGGPGTTYTIGTINGQNKSADGLVITGSEIFAQTADANNPGLVNTGSQTFAGVKTFAPALTSATTSSTTYGAVLSPTFTVGNEDQSYISLYIQPVLNNGTLYTGTNLVYLQAGEYYLSASYQNSIDNFIFGNEYTGNSRNLIGQYNTFLGANSATLVSTTNYTTTVGHGAGRLISTGSHNTIVGANSGYNATGDTTKRNVIIGALTGNTISNSSTVTAIDSSVLIGYDVKPFTVSGDVNTIIIGASAVGKGSNTVVLGNDSITKTYLKGVVNVNTTNYTGDQALATDVNKNIISVAKVDLVPTMGGANGISAGTKGIVPAPTATDDLKFLRGDATWANGVTTIGTINSQPKNANGLVISGSNIYAQTADADNPGLINTTSQTIAGDKTFNNNVTVGQTLGIANHKIYSFKNDFTKNYATGENIIFTLDGSPTISSTNIIPVPTGNATYSGIVNLSIRVTQITGTIVNTTVNQFHTASFTFNINYISNTWTNSGSGTQTNNSSPTGIFLFNGTVSATYASFLTDNSLGFTFRLIVIGYSGGGTYKVNGTATIQLLKT